MGDNQALAAAFETALRANDFGLLAAALQEHGADDFVQDWPQSGERLTKEQALRIGEGYGEGSGTSPNFTYRRMIGGGDVFVIEGSIDYGDGVPVSYVGIGEIRDGRVAHVTEYFASPFEVPAWRAGMTGRIPEPTPA